MSSHVESDLISSDERKTNASVGGILVVYPTSELEVATMPYATNQGVRIHYRVEGKGPLLVLQHGFTWNMISR